MALFGKTKNTDTAQAPASAAPASRNAVPVGISHVLKHARVTEKASMHQGVGVYVFDVAESATKREVMHAVKSLYGVNPRKVAIVRVPTKHKRNMRTGKPGVKRGGKKAYVFLKSGEAITLA